MRKLVGLVLVLAVLAGLLSIVDILARNGVQAALAARIEAREPGSHAVVTISSFPFLGRLAANGTVPSLRADVTDVTAGSLHLERIDFQLEDLKVSRNRLLHGAVEPLSIRRGQVEAAISQASLDAVVHLPLTLGHGTVGAAGVAIAVHPLIDDGAIVIPLPGGLPSLKVSVPELDILPCVGTAVIVPGAVQLSCSFTALPGLLAGATFHA